MEKYQINIISKATGEKTVLESELTEKQAISFCEMWGWSYCDEYGKSYWLEWETQEV